MAARARGELDEARAARRRLADALDRGAAARGGARHGARPFVTERELEAQMGRVAPRIAERATERVLQRDRIRAGALMPCRRRRPDPSQPVPRYTLTRKEAAASLGISLNHFERRVQPELKVVISGQLVLIPVVELERWVRQRAPEAPVRRRGRGVLPTSKRARRG